MDIAFSYKLSKESTFLVSQFATRILQDAPYFLTEQVRDSRMITPYTLRIAGPFVKRVSKWERKRKE